MKIEDLIKLKEMSQFLNFKLGDKKYEEFMTDIGVEFSEKYFKKLEKKVFFDRLLDNYFNKIKSAYDSALKLKI